MKKHKLTIWALFHTGIILIICLIPLAVYAAGNQSGPVGSTIKIDYSQVLSTYLALVLYFGGDRGLSWILKEKGGKNEVNK